MDTDSRIEGYLRRLFGYAFSLTRDPHRAEDLVQECAVRALSSVNTPVDMQITISAMKQAGGQPAVIGGIVGTVKAVASLIVIVLFVREVI